MSLSLTLSKNEIVKYHIRLKIHELIAFKCFGLRVMSVLYMWLGSLLIDVKSLQWGKYQCDSHLRISPVRKVPMWNESHLRGEIHWVKMKKKIKHHIKMKTDIPILLDPTKILNIIHAIFLLNNISLIFT